MAAIISFKQKLLRLLRSNRPLLPIKATMVFLV
nr:MAG TPA: hypothetical protein [Caudoviricetes sp.]